MGYFTDGPFRMSNNVMRHQKSQPKVPDEDFTHYTQSGYHRILVPLDLSGEIDEVMHRLMREKFRIQLIHPENFPLVQEYIRSDQFRELLQEEEIKAALADDDDEDEQGSDKLRNRDLQGQGISGARLLPLKSPSDFPAPSNLDSFVRAIHHCMNDGEEYAMTEPNLIRVFTAKAAVQFAEEVGEDSERMPRAWRMFSHFAKNNGYRQIIEPSDEIEARLLKLRFDFPNFEHVVDHLINQLRLWPLKHPDERRFRPLMLDGPKGAGKTAFAKELSKTLNTRYAYFNVASASMGGILTGISSKWGNGQAGLIFSEMARSETASPLILLDEIDKAIVGGSFPIEGALLNVLEPQTSREMRDEFGGLEFDASRVIYVATSNDLNMISAPLLSRFDVFAVDYPDPSQRELIIRNMLKKQYLQTILTPLALSILARQDGDLRALQSLLDKVVSQHVQAVLNQMGAKEQVADKRSAEGCEAGEEKTNPRVSLYGPQVIDELTVRICLAQLGVKTQSHFGFIHV